MHNSHMYCAVAYKRYCTVLLRSRQCTLCVSGTSAAVDRTVATLTHRHLLTHVVLHCIHTHTHTHTHTTHYTLYTVVAAAAVIAQASRYKETRYTAVLASHTSSSGPTAAALAPCVSTCSAAMQNASCACWERRVTWLMWLMT
jgi:hypothetical protein